jgi:hypothetical protein
MKIFNFLKNFNFIQNKNNEVASGAEIVNEPDRNSYFNFEKLNKKIINQDDIELNGEGTCIMTSGSDRYGHIKFKFYISDKNNSEIVWSISEEKLPNDYRNSVNKVANLFIDFIEKERNDLRKFTFEIIDSSYHPVDARPVAYEVATFRAIQNSFDEKLHQPNLKLLVKRKVEEPKKWKNFKKK